MFCSIQMNSLIHCVMSTTYYTSMCEGQPLVNYLLHCYVYSTYYTVYIWTVSNIPYTTTTSKALVWYHGTRTHAYILPVCGCPEARPKGVTANVEDIRGRILRVSGVYLTYTTVTHALGAIKCTITELGVYASTYILPAIDQSAMM